MVVLESETTIQTQYYSMSYCCRGEYFVHSNLLEEIHFRKFELETERFTSYHCMYYILISYIFNSEVDGDRIGLKCF